MSESWVNAVIELTIPLGSVVVNSPDDAKLWAAGEVLSRVLEALPESQFGQFVGSARWEDAER